MRPERLRHHALAIMGAVVAAALLFVSPAAAQQNPGYPAARLSTIFPPGAKAGTTVEVTLTGDDLEEATTLYFSTPSLKAERIPDPPEPKDKKKPNNAPPPPPRFKITVPADAPHGVHDVRVIGKWGMSNPRAFAIGTLPEIVEKEPNDDVDKAQKVELGSVVNGVINNRTDVDYFSFAGKKGQCVVIHCAASTIDSRLLAFVELYDATGRKLGSNRHYRDRDALLSCVLPQDGDYIVRLCEFAYQNGGPESVYRLTISAGPWIDAAFPPALAPGKATQVTLYGRNLPGRKPLADAPRDGGLESVVVNITPPPPSGSTNFPGRMLPGFEALDGFAYHIGDSNSVLLTYANAPVVLDSGDNDSSEKAQPVAVPCEICGRIERRGDRDHFAFDAKKGDVIILEGYADRLRSPVDLVLSLHRADNGQLIAEFDDNPEVPSNVEKFYTRTEDPWGKFVVPADGKYDLIVRDRGSETKTSPRHVYRVSLRREQPDFRLVMVGNHETGAGFTLRRGSCEELQIVCFRRDGFDGEVTVTADGLPAGVTCEPQVLGPKLRQGALVLSAADNAADWAGAIRVKGTATINGKQVVREAQAGCLVFPTANNVPAVSRLARSLCMAVRDPGPFALAPAVKELAVPIGGTAAVKVKAQKRNAAFKDKVSVDLTAGPAQQNGQPIKTPKVTIDPDKEAELKFNIPGNTPPGNYSLVFRGEGKLPMEDPKTKKKTNATFVAVSPPIRLTIYDTACELAFASPGVSVKPGAETVIPIKLKRLHGFDGEFRIELVVPNGVGGISAAAVTVPAKALDGRLILKADKGAKPAKDIAFLVRATAKVGNSTLKEEAKLAVSIDPQAAASPSVPAPTPTASKAVILLADGAADWKYTASVKGDAWQKPEFDDKGWKAVKAPFGYGEAEIAKRKGTEIGEKGQTIYARRAFDVPADLLKQKGVTFRLRVASDDGAAVYFNGKLADDDSASDHEFSYWNRDLPLPAALLKPGRNVVAVKVSNTPGSSDVYLDMVVAAEVPAPKK